MTQAGCESKNPCCLDVDPIDLLEADRVFALWLWSGFLNRFSKILINDGRKLLFHQGMSPCRIFMAILFDFCMCMAATFTSEKHNLPPSLVLPTLESGAVLMARLLEG